jgi:hypothetical protein
VFFTLWIDSLRRRSCPSCVPRSTARRRRGSSFPRDPGGQRLRESTDLAGLAVGGARAASSEDLSLFVHQRYGIARFQDPGAGVVGVVGVGTRAAGEPRGQRAAVGFERCRSGTDSIAPRRNAIFCPSGKAPGRTARPSRTTGLGCRSAGKAAQAARPRRAWSSCPKMSWSRGSCLQIVTGQMLRAVAVRRCREACAGGPHVALPPGRPWTPASPTRMPTSALQTAQPRARRRVAASGEDV